MARCSCCLFLAILVYSISFYRNAAYWSMVYFWSCLCRNCLYDKSIYCKKASKCSLVHSILSSFHMKYSGHRIINLCPLYHVNQSVKHSEHKFHYPLISSKRKFLFICISFSNTTHHKGRVTNSSNFYHELNN